MSFLRSKSQMVAPESALRGRDHYEFTVPDTHFVNGHRIQPPFERDDLEVAYFGMGCFWGGEEIYWDIEGVWTTAVGYAGGFSGHPSYEEVCSGRTGHTETVLVAFDPSVVSYADLVKKFFTIHDPTQGMRQGNDIGTQYRSGIYTTSPEQLAEAEKLARIYSEKLESLGYGSVTTEIAPLATFYYAEGYHQQYLAKNPNGYRCHSTTDVPFPA